MIIPPSCSAAIFDLNGTIIDDEKFHVAAFTEFFRRHGIPKTGEDYLRECRALRNDEIMKAFFGDISVAESEALANEKEKIYRDLYAPHVAAVPGFLELAQFLRKRGTKLGLATSSMRANVTFVLESLDMEAIFDEVVCGNEVLHGKPHPEIYFVAAELLDVDPGECVVFEDAPAGVHAALAAGMRVFVRGEEPHEEAEAVFRDFTDFSLA